MHTKTANCAASVSTTNGRNALDFDVALHCNESCLGGKGRLVYTGISFPYSILPIESLLVKIHA